MSLAWAKLDKDSNGVIDILDLRGVYSGSDHPDVKSGRKTEEEVLAEFLETFEIHHDTRDHRVTRQEF